MDIIPQTTTQYKRAFTLLFIGNVILLVVIIAGYRWLLGHQSNTANLPSHQPEPPNFNCQPQTTNHAWTGRNNAIISTPKCLTVMNGSWGSRFNIDVSFAENTIRSSSLGTLEDRPLSLSLHLTSNNQTTQLFPVTANQPVKINNHLGYTYQTIEFIHPDATVEFTITNPYAATKSSTDPGIKFATAPIFYIDLRLINTKPESQELALSLHLPKSTDHQTKNQQHYLYFENQTQRDAQFLMVAPSSAQYQSPTRQLHFSQTVAAQQAENLKLTFLAYTPAPVMTKYPLKNPEPLSFAYTNFFNSIDQVAAYARDYQPTIREETQSFEEILQSLTTDPQLKWLSKQAFHSYLGNTWLLQNQSTNQLEYYVWEGEFKYLNTVDVAYDHAVLEGLLMPWVLKLQLQSWADHVQQDKYGAVIPHDLGKRFKIYGQEAYHLAKDSPSSMPVEENANFILLTYWYWHQTGDDAFVQTHLPLMQELFQSLKNRDTNHNGIADVGVGITTYDNDGNRELKQAPDNVYLGIKQFAAYLALSAMLPQTNQTNLIKDIDTQAETILQSLESAYQSHSHLPITLQNPNNPKHQSYTIITGLLYPTLTHLNHPLLGRMVNLMAMAYPPAYQTSLVTQNNHQGLRLAQPQTLGLGWLSHSVIADYIAKDLLGQTYQSHQLFFPYLIDNPYAYADGQYFTQPIEQPKTTLTFYPRGVALFTQLANQIEATGLP